MKRKYKPLTAPVKFDWSNPWKFRLDQHVYVWGFNQESSFRILDRMQLGPANFPHYLVCSHEGDLWTVPQIHLSSKPLS